MTKGRNSMNAPVRVVSSEKFKAPPGSLGVVTERPVEVVTFSTQLNQQFGDAPEFVTCPDNLEGTVGATLRCTLTDCNWTRTDGYSAHP